MLNIQAYIIQAFVTFFLKQENVAKLLKKIIDVVGDLQELPGVADALEKFDTQPDQVASNLDLLGQRLEASGKVDKEQYAKILANEVNFKV